MDSIGIGVFLAGKALLFFSLLMIDISLLLGCVNVVHAKKIAAYTFLSSILILVPFLVFDFEVSFLILAIWGWSLVLGILYLISQFFIKGLYKTWKESFRENKYLLFAVILLTFYLVGQYITYMNIGRGFGGTGSNIIFDSFSVILFPFFQ